MEIKECIREDYLRTIPVDKNLVKKEIMESDYDIERAFHAFEENDYKWCIIKSYYAMFHASRALLFSMGLQERRHFAIEVVLEELNKQGKIESRFIADFSSAMSAREDADYRYHYSKETASEIMETAKEFIKKLKSMAVFS